MPEKVKITYEKLPFVYHYMVRNANGTTNSNSLKNGPIGRDTRYMTNAAGKVHKNKLINYQDFIIPPRSREEDHTAMYHCMHKVLAGQNFPHDPLGFAQLIHDMLIDKLPDGANTSKEFHEGTLKCLNGYKHNETKPEDRPEYLKFYEAIVRALDKNKPKTPNPGDLALLIAKILDRDKSDAKSAGAFKESLKADGYELGADPIGGSSQDSQENKYLGMEEGPDIPPPTTLATSSDSDHGGEILADNMTTALNSDNRLTKAQVNEHLRIQTPHGYLDMWGTYDDPNFGQSGESITSIKSAVFRGHGTGAYGEATLARITYDNDGTVLGRKYLRQITLFKEIPEYLA